MTDYIKPSTGEVKSQGAWRNVNKHRSIPKVWDASVLKVLELEPILAAPAPAPSGDYINVVLSDPVKDALGNWVQGYVERPMFVKYADSEDATITVAAQIRTYEAARLANARTERQDELAANRYELEVAGITVDGAEIDTSRASQSMLAGASISSDRDDTKTFDWKGADGWVSLDKAQLAAIVFALGDHIEELFSTERVASDLIDAATTVNAVLAVDITLGG